MNKIKFNNDYSPYTKGQIVVVDARSYNFYLSVGVASVYDECNCNKVAKKKCSGCEKSTQPIIEDPIEEVIIKAPVKKKKSITKKKAVKKN